MPLTQQLLFHVPSILLGTSMVAFSIILSIGGLLIVRRYISHKLLKTHNDIAGAIFGTLGMAYTVLLAFVVVVVWQSFDKSGANVENEANCLADLVRDSESLSQGFRQQVHALADEYAKAVINEEWKVLGRGEPSRAGSGE